MRPLCIHRLVKAPPGGLIQKPHGHADPTSPPALLSRASHTRSPVTGGLSNCAYFTFLVFTDCAITVVFVRALVVMVHLPFDRRIVHW